MAEHCIDNHFLATDKNKLSLKNLWMLETTPNAYLILLIASEEKVGVWLTTLLLIFFKKMISIC